MSKLSQVWHIANELTADIQAWILLHDGVNAVLRFRQEDQLRLLKLRTWERRYYLPVEEILDMLIPVLRSQIKNKRKRWVLGVTVRALTGAAASRILQEQIDKRYPQSEHIQIWKEIEREKQLAAEENEGEDLPSNGGKVLSVLQCASAEDYVAAYRQKIARQREELAEQRRLHRCRPYRRNPWL